MKKIAYLLIALTTMVFTFTSCSDVPMPYEQPSIYDDGSTSAYTRLQITSPLQSKALAFPSMFAMFLYTNLATLAALSALFSICVSLFRVSTLTFSPCPPHTYILPCLTCCSA